MNSLLLSVDNFSLCPHDALAYPGAPVFAPAPKIPPFVLLDRVPLNREFHSVAPSVFQLKIIASCFQPCTMAAAFGRWPFHHAVKRFFASMTISSTAKAISAKSKRLCRFLNSSLCSYPRFIFSPLPFKPTGALERAPRLCRSVCASAPVTAVCPFRFAQKRARTRSGQRPRFCSHGKQGGMTDAALCGWRDTLPPYLISGAPWRSEKGRGRALKIKRSDTYAALAACIAPSGGAFPSISLFSFVLSSWRLVAGLADRLALEGAPACGEASSASGASAKFITGTLTKRIGRKPRR